MKRIVLENKPLVEAIFEVRWNLEEIQNGIQLDAKNGSKKPTRIDPHYQLLIGRLYDKLNEDYPFHESLPTSRMPDEISAYIIQHRFRVSKNKWPLVQIGPGILTVNDTEGYVWEGFIQKIKKILNVLFQLYPNSDEELNINSLMLRYIDAVEFDFTNQDVLDFLKNKLKTEIKLYEKLFQGTSVLKEPANFDIKFDFNVENPKGIIFLRFSKGYNKTLDKYALMWETVFKSDKQEIPNDPESIIEWVNRAHDLTDDWFFKLIEGQLEERFK